MVVAATLFLWLPDTWITFLGVLSRFGGSDGKGFTLQCGRPGFDPWVGTIPWRKEMATHSSILAWKTLWTEEPMDRQSIDCPLQQSMGSQRVGHDWATSLSLFKDLRCLDTAMEGAVFPGGSVGKESTHNAGDLSLIPESGRSPGEGNGNPLQYSCLGGPVDRGAWWATVHVVAKNQTWLTD